jgi:carbamoylphosphate synthase large subunit
MLGAESTLRGDKTEVSVEVCRGIHRNRNRLIDKEQDRNKTAPRVVLLGSAGTGAAFGAASALRRVWSQSVKIVAMDINPRHLVTTSLLAGAFEQVPLSVSPEFSTSLLRILKLHSVDTYMPIFPEELVLASEMREDSRIPATIAVMAPPPPTSVACADKWELSKLLLAHGIPTPQTALASAPFGLKEYFVKPRNGMGSRSALRVNASELAEYIGKRSGEWVVQEICEKPEVTVDAFYDPVTDNDRAICRERIEARSGVSTKCRLFTDETLKGFAKRIAAVLNLKGSFCFQVMQGANGWVVTDVNPRPGAATAMCVAAGNDFFAASFALYWGEDSQRFFSPLEGELFVTRQYSEFLMGQSA